MIQPINPTPPMGPLSPLGETPMQTLINDILVMLNGGKLKSPAMDIQGYAKLLKEIKDPNISDDQKIKDMQNAEGWMNDAWVDITKAMTGLSPQSASKLKADFDKIKDLYYDHIASVTTSDIGDGTAATNLQTMVDYINNFLTDAQNA
jgi:hypothetical protein